jgi:hypothetical protein
MPSTSAKQHRFMAAIAHSPSFAKKVGVSQSVGKDFDAADKGKTFNKGGIMKTRKFVNDGYVDDSDMDDEGNTRSKYEIDPDSRRAHGLYDEKPVVKKLKRAFKKPPFKGGQEGYDEAGRFLGGQRGFNEAGTANKSGTKQTQFAKGGMLKESKEMVGKEVAFFKKKGAPASMIKHEKAEMGMKKGGGIESRGKTKGTIIRMAMGGSVSSASRRADGIAQRGKTKC